MKKVYMKAESFELIKLKETKLNIIRLNNLVISPQGEFFDPNAANYFKGNTFLGLYHYHFHHHIMDTVAQYEYLKSYVPDLDIEFVAPFGYPVWRKEITDRSSKHFIEYLKNVHFGTEKEKIGMNIEQHKYFEDTFYMYDTENKKNIYAKESDVMVFDSVYFLIDDGLFFSKEMLKDVGLTENEIPWLSEEWIASSLTKMFDEWGKLDWEDPGLKAARIKLNEYMYDIPDSPKKIYISRQKANERYLKEKEINLNYVDKNMRERYFEREADLEAYFNSLGYVSFTLEGTSFFNQLRIFHNATHIASLSGSAFINILGCKPDAKLIEVRALMAFPYCYERYANILGLKYKCVDLRELDHASMDIAKEMSRFRDEF